MNALRSTINVMARGDIMTSLIIIAIGLMAYLTR